MSSIDTKSGQDERVRQAREDYRNKESELVKKHNQEMRRSTESHIQEIDRLRTNHSSQMKNLRDKSATNISRRDAKYQKEIDSLRKMHHEHMQKMTRDNKQREQITRDASQREIHQAYLGREDRVQELHERYNESLAQVKQSNSDKMNEVREQQKASLDTITAKLENQRRKEVDLLSKERAEMVTKNKNEYRTMRNHLTSEVKDLKLKNAIDHQAQSQDKMDTIEQERRLFNDTHKRTRMGFQESLEDVRDKYSKQLEDRSEMAQAVGRENKNSIKSRYDNKINSLNREVRMLGDQNIRSEIAVKADAKRQIANAKDAYEDKYKKMQEDREELLQTSNQRNSSKLKEAKSEADSHVVKMGRYYRGQVEMENFKNREALDSTSKDFELRMSAQKSNTDARVDKMREDYLESEKRLQNQFATSLEVQKDSALEEKREIRLSSQQDKSDAIQNMRVQFQKQETNHARKLTDTIAKYERRIAEMQDRFVKDKALSQNRENRLVSELKRQHDYELEVVKSKYTDKNRDSNVRHQKEVEGINRRHQEKMDELAATINKNELNKV